MTLWFTGDAVDGCGVVVRGVSCFGGVGTGGEACDGVAGAFRASVVGMLGVDVLGTVSTEGLVGGEGR